MAKTLIGLDIGSTAVRAAEVATGDVPVLSRAAQVPLPSGAVENGEVRQPQVVAEALKELWGRSRIRGRQVRIGVGNQRVVVREIALPWLPDKELRASLGFQVQEFIPISVDEAVLDFDPLGEFELEGRRMLRILLVAAQKLMISEAVTAVQAARLDPVGIDLNPFALVRAVGTVEGLNLETPGDEAVVDVGAHVTNISVHDRGIARFVRILPTEAVTSRSPSLGRWAWTTTSPSGSSAGRTWRGGRHPRRSSGSPCPAPGPSSMRSDRRSSSTRPRCPGPGSGAYWSRAGARSFAASSSSCKSASR